jgi:RHS repeat-associated protein
MPDGNPLIAQERDTTTAVTGIGIAESAQGLAHGVSNGDWVEAGLSAAGVGLEVLSMVIDPLGTLASYGVSWLIEHVRPLKEALDWFAGDPPVIQSFSETWGNVAAEVNAISQEFLNEAGSGTAGWTGQAGDAYRGHATEAADAIAAAGTLADGISAGVMIMGEVVAFVREFIRDMVGELVGRLIAWALQLAATLGLATPAVVAQATAAITRVVNKVADLVRKLVKTISNVAPRIRKIISKLDEIMAKLAKLMRRGDGGGTTPSSASTTPNGSSAPTTNGPDTTAPSSSPDGGPSAGTDAGPAGGSRDGAPDGGRTDGNSPNRPADPQQAATRPEERTTCNDPVDVATGQVVMVQTDVALTAMLPLLLRRVHLSSYRAGRSFGPSWASTLDQRLEFDDQGVVFIGEDGVQLVYPEPAATHSVLPRYGPLWSLHRADNDIFSIHQPDSGLTLHFGPGDGRTAALRSVSDRNGNGYQFDYDDAGAVSGVRHSGGYHVLVDTVGGLVTKLRLDNPGGDDLTLAEFRYRDGARLTEVINSSGQPLRMEYDHAGRLTKWTDRNGMWYRYLYDERGRCVANQGAGGYLDGTFTYDRDAAGGTTRFTDALGNATVYRLNAAGHTVSETNPLGHTTTYERDERGRLLSRTDPLGNTQRREYDERGNLVRVTMPDGTQALAEYNALGLPVTHVDPDGAVWRYTYDERGNTVAATDPAGNTTRYGHDSTGAVVSRVDALGQSTTTVNNAAGLPVTVTDAVGATVTYTYDPLGRIASATDPLGNTTSLTWSVEGRLLSRTGVDGSVERMTYDGEGCLVGYRDSAGQSTRREITAFDLVSAEIDEIGARTEYSYDANLRLTAVTNPQGLVWRYEYEAAGNLIREIDFNDRVVSYEHDAAGQLVRRTNGAGQAVRFTRDAMGRVVARHTDDATTTFEFDQLGRLRRATNPNADVVVERDILGAVVAETVNGRAITSRYDALGRRLERRTPTGARSTWTYDPVGRVVQLDSNGRTLTFGHDLAGHETERAFDFGVRMTQTWDDMHRLTEQRIHTVASSGAGVGRNLPLQERNYRYRTDNQLVSVHDSHAGTRRFNLDHRGRLLGVVEANRRERYAYDHTGNLVAAQRDDELAGHPAGGRRQYQGTMLRAAGNSAYTYDRQGRMVTRVRKRLSKRAEVWNFTWDAEDRLVGVRTPDGSRWRYRYDPLGRRIAKERVGADGETLEHTRFFWDGVELAEQLHHTGLATTWEFAPRGLKPLTQVERMITKDAPQSAFDTAFYAIVTDLVGSPTELIDPHGKIAWRGQTTAWGEAIGRLTYRASTPLRFPGQYFDAETGLHYNYYRYYDPETGRYVSSDPLGLGGGPNPYGYVSNPTGLADPLGLITCDEEARQVLRETDPYDPAHAERRSEARRQLYRDAERPPTTEERRLELIREARRELYNQDRGLPNDLRGARIDYPTSGAGQIHAQGPGVGAPGLNYDGSFSHGDPRWNRQAYEYLYDHGFAWPTGGDYGGQSPGTHEW